MSNKEAQLCAEAHEILSLSLADATDHRLQCMSIDRVQLRDNARKLCVSVSVELGEEGLPSLEEAKHALLHARSYLRRQVAAGIARKRTPELEFELRPSALALDGL
ncbi:MAG: hypothetical protein RBU37_18730 [Myxococcota bacterium]|nr:hypothetical protein [Myxococcota bacterium]